MFLSSIGDFFAVILVIVGGSLLFYLPALLLSFLTGQSVRMGSRFGPKVKAGISLGQVLRSSPSTTRTIEIKNTAQGIKVEYENYDGSFRLAGNEVRIVIGRTMKLRASPQGGVWISNDPTIASIDPDSGIVHGILLGVTTIIYTVNRRYVRVTLEVRQPRVNPFIQSTAK